MPRKAHRWIPAFTFVTLATALVFIATISSASISFAATGQPAYSPADVRDTLNRYCVTCHNPALRTARLELDNLDVHQVSADAPVWEKVMRKLRNRQMPPAGSPRPDVAVYDGLIGYLATELDRAAEESPNPGRPDVHRLNRAEYSNVIRDLLGLQIDGRELLPADDIGYGFDNIADVLTVSPLLLERYLSAAAKISRVAVGDTSMPPSYKTYELPRSLVQAEWMGNDLPFGSRGGMAVDHYFPVDGEYQIKVKMQTGRFDEILGRDRERQVDIRLDGERLGRFSIAVVESEDTQLHGEEVVADDHVEVRIPVKAGTREVIATMVSDRIKAEGRPKVFIAGSVDNDESAFYEGIGSISIGGPYTITGPGDTASRERIFVCRPSPTVPEADCAREIIANLARRAYRRPLADEDLPALLELFEQGRARGNFDNGIRLALQKILVSPEFLFRLERDKAGVNPGDAYPVSDIELASRLSFFLWSSIPDEELLGIAERGELGDPGILQHQLQRMLADPRSSALVENFAGQWLYLRNMERVLPDPLAFPDFDDNLREALQQETRLLMEAMLREDRSVVELLDSDFTYVNERLARHYGIKGVYGSEFRRIAVTDERRRGLLGHGSILTVTSYPNRTAPTIRGKWVLEQLLGTPPPPPPPDVPSLKEDGNTRTLTMRERMELHRANPACAVCHKVMDPLGFALENFDGLGRWRETSGLGTDPIDASGVLPDGTRFDGPAELREVLLGKQDLFVETFTERLLTYALGRGVESYDYPVVRKIRLEAEPGNYRWSAIISGIVNSVPFRMRRASES